MPFPEFTNFYYFMRMVKEIFDWYFSYSLGSSMANLHTILKYATKSMNSRFQLAALEWFIKNDLQDESRSIKQILEHVQGNVNWMNRNYKNIVHWLRREKNSTEVDMI